MPAGYLQLSKEELEQRAKKAWQIFSSCSLCPRKCGVNRLANSRGFCSQGIDLIIDCGQPRFDQESLLVGSGGTGAILFSSCNLKCIYCQEYRISQLRRGEACTTVDLAKMMVNLQYKGCHNINLISPTIWVPQILHALPEAIRRGLTIPLAYNTSGYESLETLKLLEGIVDIYLPDIKYSNNISAAKYSLAGDYWIVARQALLEMHRQVGDLEIANGLAQKGLLIRHLILPNNLSGIEKILSFIATLSEKSFLNLTDGYRPSYKTNLFPELNRFVTVEERERAFAIAKQLGLHRFYG